MDAERLGTFEYNEKVDKIPQNLVDILLYANSKDDHCWVKYSINPAFLLFLYLRKNFMSSHTLLNTIKILYELLSAKEKKKANFIILFMLFCTLFEFLSIGALFPYLKMITDPEVIHDNTKLSYIYNLFGFTSNLHFIVFIGISIFILILFKAMVGMFNNYIQVRFAGDVKTRISVHMLKAYMAKNFNDINNSNSSFTSKHILYDANTTFATINNLLRFLTNVLLTLALVTLMLIVSSTAIIFTLAVLGGIMFASVKFTREKSQKIGRKNEKIMRYLYRSVDESLKGIRDIKVFQKEKYFIENFSELQTESQDQMVSISVMSNIPSVIVNTMGFASVLALVISLLIIKGNIITVLPMLGIIAISVQRLLPGVSLITNSFSTIRVNMAMIFKVSELINYEDDHVLENKFDHESKSKFEFSKNIEMRDISFFYDRQKPILNKTNINIPKNSIVGLVGESGSGKSTLINILLGNYIQTNGEILIDGKKVENGLLNNFNSNVAYVPQTPFIFDSTIKNNIALGMQDECIDKEALNNALNVAQLSNVITTLRHGIDEELGEDATKFSGGQKQRIGIARAIYTNADLLIFDESTSALDIDTERKFYESLVEWSANKKTIIIISHRDTLFNYCDNIICLDSKKNVSSDSQNIFSKRQQEYVE